jgi:hypothetical protein
VIEQVRDRKMVADHQGGEHQGRVKSVDAAMTGVGHEQSPDNMAVAAGSPQYAAAAAVGPGFRDGPLPEMQKK